jgi:hypothetical protein
MRCLCAYIDECAGRSENPLLGTSSTVESLCRLFSIRCLFGGLCVNDTALSILARFGIAGKHFFTLGHLGVVWSIAYTDE